MPTTKVTPIDPMELTSWKSASTLVQAIPLMSSILVCMYSISGPATKRPLQCRTQMRSYCSISISMVSAIELFSLTKDSESRREKPPGIFRRPAHSVHLCPVSRAHGQQIGGQRTDVRQEILYQQRTVRVAHMKRRNKGRSVNYKVGRSRTSRRQPENLHIQSGNCQQP